MSLHYTLMSKLQVYREIEAKGLDVSRVDFWKCYRMGLRGSTMTASTSFQISANESAFEMELVRSIHHFKQFENKVYQEKALQLVPLEELQATAQAKYDTNLVTSSPPATVMVQDMLLKELLEWFQTFFSWMDSPPCPQCQRQTQGIGLGVPTPHEMSESASRVELFTCPHCFTDNRPVARFPRYTNPAVLLDKRIGRCGEWVNCFTLICRALEFETRCAHDHTDHSWVEVHLSNRWVHVDPCENSYDNPLLYEVGWGKKLTYVIAVSQDDIQDVTPRYSRNFKNVLERRNKVTESWLVSTIVRLRTGLQENLEEDRKKELSQRLVREISELITSKEEKVSKDTEKVGRKSGSLEWRQGRQELGPGTEPECCSPNPGFVWDIAEDYVVGGKFVMSYDGNFDTYVVASRLGDVSVFGWKNGVFSSNEMWRKVERDWNMVYLAPGENSGGRTSNIVWKFKVDPDLSVVDIQFRMTYSIFQRDARLRVCLSTEQLEMKTLLETNRGDNIWIWNSSWNNDPEFQAEIRRSKTFTITCELTKGSGNEGWQKVQLFRQEFTNEKSWTEFNRSIFTVECTLKKLNRLSDC